MNPRTGIAAVAAVFAVYTALYWQHALAAAMPLDAQISYFAGSCSAICMALALLLSARPRAAETPFGGLDRMYRLHKYLGVAALLLFIAHFATVPGGPEGGAALGAAGAGAGAPAGGDAGSGEDGLPIDLFGLIAMIGFTLLIVVTLNRKIPYHRWFPTHRLMGLFFAVAVVHVFLALLEGEPFALVSAPGLFLALLLPAGLAAYVYKQLIHPRRRKHAFSVAAVNRLERATEVVLAPKGGMFAFEPGQFAFVTVDADGFREAHPFTISSGAGEGVLRLTMKVLGDYTRRVRDGLAAGADAAVEGPYGRFNPLKGTEKQVWVAGGIGITPFLSVLRTMRPGHGRTVRLYWCVRTAGEALFLDEVRARAAELGGVTVTLFDSQAGERLDADALAAELGGDPGGWSCWLCGPKPLVVAVSGAVAARGVPERRIHTEEFEFR